MSYLEALLTEAAPTAKPSPVAVKLEVTTLTVVKGFDNTSKDTLPQAIKTLEPKIPSWATPPYQVLSFELGDIVYAANLQHLHGILPLPVLTRVPTSIPWFLGLFRHRGVNVKVIDLSRILDPARKPLVDSADNIEPAGFVFLLDEGRWGFLAGRVKNIVTLREDAVKWRRNIGPHQVPVGTLVEKMWTLLDLASLVDGLTKGVWVPKA